MKIAIVCFNLSWQSGGPRLIFSLAQVLKRSAHTVVIYAADWNGKYFPELYRGLDIRVIRPPAPFVWSYNRKDIFSRSWQKLSQERLRLEAAKNIAAAMDDDFDIVNVHDFAYPVSYFYKRRNPKSKIIWTENDPPYMHLPKENFLFDMLSRFYNRFKDITARQYFRAIDRVVVLDLYNKAWCEKRGLTPAVIRVGVDFEKFYLPIRDFSIKARAKKVRLFGLGSLNKYRRYEDTIRAVKYLRDWAYDAEALIIANDQWNEKEYRQKLLTIIKEESVGKFIDLEFQGVSEDDLRQAYRETDIFVYAMYLPPPRNGFGFSIGVFEAMAAGSPVILCRTTTSTEVLEDGGTALFVDPMSPEQIAEKVKFIIDNPGQYTAIAGRGQQFVREHLSWERYTREFIDIITQ